MSEMHEANENHRLPTGDVIVCLLGAFVLVFAVWAVVFGLFAGANYALAQFQITLPDVAISALDMGAKLVPAMAALLAGFLGYRFLIRLP